jgi:hypothetical protein
VSKRFFTPIDLTGTISDSPASERSMKWSDGEGTLELGLKGGNVKLEVGQQEVALCYNGTGSTIPKGSVVYISGAQGQRPRISLASASSEISSSKTFGITSEQILNGAEGFVTTFGIIRNVNTSGYTPGQALWLSTTAGAYTNTAPVVPNHSVFVGYCIKANASSGQIFVNIQNGYELQELHNVFIENPLNGQALRYNSTTGLWENESIDGGVFEVFYQPSAPSSPLLGDIWVDSDESIPTYNALTINDLLPNQSSNSGKFLTTNGSSPSWATIDLSTYATLNSPSLTGTPIAPTASAGTNTTQIATTAFVRTEVTNLVASAPSALDTLDELAAALGDDANFATTVTNSLAGKEPTITSGTTSQYWRGDKTWQTLNKSSVGLSNVENTALSTWAGSSNITTLGTISSGTWQGSSISSTYIDPAIARLSSPTFTGTANAERLSVDSTAYIDTITTTVSSTSATEIDSFVQSLFSSCEYLIQIKQGSKVTILKALMTSVDLDIVQYGIVESGGTIPYTITTDSFIPGGGSVTNKLLITITDANSTSATVKVVRTSVV